MKLSRKILASLLALVMVLLMLPTAMAAENTYVLDATTDLEAQSAADANLGKEIVVNDYFTVIMSAKTKIDSSNKTFDDGYAGSQRLNFQSKTAMNEDAGKILPAVKFTTSGAATIKLWWVEGGEDNRQMAILNEAGEEVVRTSESLAKNELCISELKLEAAGTYYLGTPDGSNYLFKMEVTESAAADPEPTPDPDPVAPSVPSVADGKYVIAYGNLTFSSLAEDKTYGYPPALDASNPIDADYITITNVGDGKFTMQDVYGRYIYVAGTFDSYNVSAELPSEGYEWILEDDGNGAYYIKNVEKEKYLSYNEQYNSWNCYATDKGAPSPVTLTAQAGQSPVQPLPPTGDLTTCIVILAMLASAACLVVLTKKRAF